MENQPSEQSGQKQTPQYKMLSRGKKTKGNSYKDRYVEKTCPECNHTRAYADKMKTLTQYSCLKRDCRHKWVERISLSSRHPRNTPPTES